MSRRFINQLTEQESIDEIFLVADKQLRANRQGSHYLLLKLSDRTGKITAMLWNAEDRVVDGFQRGDYARCQGRTQLYNGNLQAILTSVQKIGDDQVERSDFEQFDAGASERNESRLREFLEGMRNVHLRRLGQAFLDDPEFMERLRLAPAAISNHHAFPGGLLLHTLELMELAALVAPRYPKLDAELLVMGAFLHDLGKTEEMSLVGESTYTDRGQLVGHIVIGVQMLGEKVREVAEGHGEAIPCELRWHLEHLIISHHGNLEFGSPRVPASLEALALHHLDNLDAKIAAATSVIESDLSGDERWTNYNPVMQRKFLKP